MKCDIRRGLTLGLMNVIDESDESLYGDGLSVWFDFGEFVSSSNAIALKSFSPHRKQDLEFPLCFHRKPDKIPENDEKSLSETKRPPETPTPSPEWRTSVGK